MLQFLPISISIALVLQEITLPSGANGLLQSRQSNLRDNSSALPPGWSGEGQCWEDFGFAGPTRLFLLGPSFIDDAEMTIESCVDFCDQQDYRLAGIEAGNECHCGMFFNPDTGFESDFGECDIPCVGNAEETCGGFNSANPLMNLFQKNDGRCNNFPGRTLLTSGPWRFSYYYNDTVGARALPHNAVDLHPSLPRGNLTIESCVNACSSSGFSLAGMEFADECYCGNALEHNSQPIAGCFDTLVGGALPCKGDQSEFCGGPNLLYVYTLPGTGLQPLIPFGSMFDGL